MELRLSRKARPRPPGFEGKRELAPDLVESAYFKGIYEPVIRNIRESSLTTMRAKGQIDDAQLRAGEWFRATYERMRHGSMAVDPGREPVDTSGISDPIPDRVIIAGEQLAMARHELGRIGYMIVELVCGQGMALQEATQARGGGLSPLQVSHTGWLLRQSLDVLARWKGFAS